MSLVSYKVSGNRPWIIGQQPGRYHDLHGGKDANSISQRQNTRKGGGFHHLKFRDKFLKETVQNLGLDS